MEEVVQRLGVVVVESVGRLEERHMEPGGDMVSGGELEMVRDRINLLNYPEKANEMSSEFSTWQLSHLVVMVLASMSLEWVVSLLPIGDEHVPFPRPPDCAGTTHQLQA